MCVLYVSFGSKVRPGTFVYVDIGSVVLFVLISRFLLYSIKSGVNRVQVILLGFRGDIVIFYPSKNCM